MTRRLIALSMLAAVSLPLPAARANHIPDADGCPIHVTETSPDNPNIVDGTGDWNGNLGTNTDALVPSGDIYREGTDITKAWINRDAEGAYTAHIQVASLSAMQPNTNFYLLWDYAGSDETKSRRWVSGDIRGYADPEFVFGYMSDDGVTGGRYVTVGTTTGHLVEGPLGEVVIDIPRGGANDDWGAPTAGATLGGLLAEATILLGSPETLPENPAGLKHGFIEIADDTTDAESWCDGYVD